MIQIVDVSGHNVSPNWAAIAAAGFTVAIVKSSEGVNSPDSKMVQHCAGARAAGLLVGTYHYLRVRHNAPQDARTQAQQYLQMWRAQNCDLVPVVDVESQGNEGRTSKEWGEAVLGWVDECRLQTGRAPCIYTSPGEWTTAGLTGLSGVSDCPLWLAQYASKASPPLPWTSYVMWQYTGSGTIAGVGPYDLSRSDDISPILMRPDDSLESKAASGIKMLAVLSVIGAAGYYIYNRVS